MLTHSVPFDDLEAADLAACRAALANGSRTFLAASYLLPRSVRDPACALYAYCRKADDAVDEAGDGSTDRAADRIAAAPRALDRLRERLDAVYRGAPQATPSDRAFAAVVRRYALPRELPEALLEGFEWDTAGRRYETLADLQAYAARVAGSVGAMMAVLMGTRDADALARACDLGVAMQLSNIARDVGEDARMGRLYLPLAWLREAGLDPDAWLAAPVFSPALGAVVQRLLTVADALYAQVGDGVARLPAGCRPGINAARHLYAQIGHQVLRQGLNSVDSRAVVATPRKLAVLAVALSTSLLQWRRPALPPLPATRFLVDAAALPQSAATPPWWNLSRRAMTLVELFDRLERRDMARTRTAR